MLTRMTDVLDTSSARCLTVEAHRCRGGAAEVDKSSEEAGPSDTRYRAMYATGEVLGQLHRSDSMIAAVSRAAGVVVEPSVATYIYYRKGDFIALHRDQEICKTVLLVWLAGPGGPLHVHPDLSHLDPDQLSRVSREAGGHPANGARHLLQEGPLLMTGSVVPHHRPPHDGDEELVMASFCFDHRPA
ncbi:hypothetical protein SAMN05421874_10557 [Nonomuraea maritima]|uniref:Cysteine dioxygenase type I n=1 Tax=Nonomuraea maritima TaxID=683260 RepID=A0A1G8Z195_9ACTN|nr:hypothetical protein [Nonomuraea maritima]SDK08020.1 hypothetical protein SAMN05421874_10557 [Nonomuraea maritima]